MNDVNRKLQKLKQRLADMGRVAVAFSGGVDSTLLLAVVRDVLGSNVMAITAESMIHPSRELEDAAELAKRLGVTHHVLPSVEMQNEFFLSNPPDRCYICKRLIFQTLLDFAAKQDCQVIDGSNADDVDDYRPGRKALQELGIQSPLQQAGLTKAEIRQLSEVYKLPTWNKPALACLASRIPYGIRITPEALTRVDAAESLLRNLGFLQVRVRDYGNLARIELMSEDIARFLDPAFRIEVVSGLKKTGYLYVSLDLEGYRTGSLNEVLKNG